MTRRRGIYERVAKAQLAGLLRTSAWLAPDHLLLVEDSGYSEQAGRYALADIEAIIVKRTTSWHAWTAAWALLCVTGLSFIYKAFMSGEPVLLGLVVVLAGIGFLGVMLNMKLGPSCNCYLQTAVRRERIPCIARAMQAEKFVERIGPAIAAVQGAVTREEAVAGASLVQNAEQRKTSIQQPAPSLRVGGRMYLGRAHDFMVMVLLVHLCASCVRMLLSGPVPLIVGFITWPALLLAAVWAIIRQHKTILPVGLKLLPWMVLAYGVGQLGLVEVHMSVRGLLHQDPSLLTYPFEMSDVSVWDSVWILLRAVLGCIFAAVAGGTGLIHMRRFRQATDAPPPLPSSPG